MLDEMKCNLLGLSVID